MDMIARFKKGCLVCMQRVLRFQIEPNMTFTISFASIPCSPWGGVVFVIAHHSTSGIGVAQRMLTLPLAAAIAASFFQPFV